MDILSYVLGVQAGKKSGGGSGGGGGSLEPGVYFKNSGIKPVIWSAAKASCAWAWITAV